MRVYNHRISALLSATTAAGPGNALDTRAAANYGYLQHAVPGASAIWQLQASMNGESDWLNIAVYTAVAASGTAQIAGYWPYLRGRASAIYSGGGNTGALTVVLAMGIVG